MANVFENIENKTEDELYALVSYIFSPITTLFDNNQKEELKKKLKQMENRAYKNILMIKLILIEHH